MKTKRKRNLKHEVLAGDDINDTIRCAIEVAKRINTVLLVTELVEFKHNGVTVIVDARSNPKLVYRDWQRALYGYIGKVVGPNYKAELSSEEVESDAKIEAEKAARR